MTAGKRPRLMMRRTVSVASLGGAGSDHPTEPQGQQQQPAHQVIGFAPKAFSENNKFLLHDATPMVFGEPSSPSSPSPCNRSGKPFSGLSLITDFSKDPPPPESSNTRVGLGIVVALENKEEMNVDASPPVSGFRSPGAPTAPPPPHVMNSPRYLPPPDVSSNINKLKSQAPDYSSAFCLETTNSSKHDRCFLRPPFTTLGFLKSCFLCKRDISHGHDIYMYRGDRAFCSAECRHQQILNDERAERRCSSAALKHGGGVNGHHHQIHHHHQHHQQPRVSRGKVSAAPATTAAAA